MALWGKVDQAADKPKYLTTAEKALTYGVSEAEAQLPANKAKGVAHAGWVKTATYTDSGSVVRNKTEVLVAMSSISGDNNADDTKIGIDPVITIDEQPTGATFELGNEDTITYTVEASVNNGGALTYAWAFSEDSGSTWDSEQPGWATGFNTATMTIPNADVDLGGGAGSLDGYLFRCVVSSAGAASVTTDEVNIAIAV
jgi:hypothetical protein